MNQIKHIVSYGAGVDSTAMIFLLLQQKKPVDYVVFADVGAELPETYQTVKEMASFLSDFDIPLITVYPAKDRSLQQRCEDRKVIPDRNRRWCTRDVKITPIFKFYRSLNSNIVQYLGIDAKESRRCRPDPEEWIKNDYPLVTAGIDREGCIKLIEKQGFPVPIKSGCYFCIFSNMERLFWLWTNHRDFFDKAVLFEEQNKHFPRQTVFPKMTLREIEINFKNGKVPSLEN